MSILKNLQSYILYCLQNQNKNSLYEDKSPNIPGSFDDNKKLKLAEGIRALDQFREVTTETNLRRMVTDLCQLFKEAYINPYYGMLGQDLAELKFDNINSVKPTEYSSYSLLDNTITLYIGSSFYNLPKPGTDISHEELNIVDFYRRGNIIVFLINCFQLIVHEYQHNLQYKGSDKLLEKHVVRKSDVEGITNKYAWQLNEEREIQDPLMIDKVGVKDMQPLIDVTKTDLQGISFKNLIFAVYFERFIEKDARRTSIDFMQYFINDIKPYLSNDIYQKFMAQNRQEEELERFNLNKNDKYFKIYNDILDNISPQDFVDYAKTIEQVFQDEKKIGSENLPKDQDAMKLGPLNLKLAKRQSYLKLAIMKHAFKFLLQDISDDKIIIKKLQESNFDKIKKFELLLLKLGFDFAVVQLNDYLTAHLSEADYRKYNEDFMKSYADMLKNDEITSGSLLYFHKLTLKDQSEIFCKFIEEGKTDFCKELIRPNKDNQLLFVPVFVRGVMYFQRILKEEDVVGEFEYNKQILDALDYRLRVLSDRHAHYKLLFDDLYDLFDLLKTICEHVGADIDNRPQFTLHADDEFDMKDRLARLYWKAKELVFFQTSRHVFAGRKNTEQCLLDQKYAYERYKSIYGRAEFERKASKDAIKYSREE